MEIKEVREARYETVLDLEMYSEALQLHTSLEYYSSWVRERYNDAQRKLWALDAQLEEHRIANLAKYNAKMAMRPFPRKSSAPRWRR